MLDEITLNRLIEAARDTMLNAHTPISSFPVGAAVLTAGGKIYGGCNTESVIPSLGVCAERSAIDHAVIHGDTDISAVLIVSRRPEPLFPCGACRQYLFEFSQASGRNIDIYALGADGRLLSSGLHELYPHSFGLKDKHF